MDEATTELMTEDKSAKDQTVQDQTVQDQTSKDQTSKDQMAINKPAKQRMAYREVAADLVESVPDNGGLFHWILASPLLLFVAWLWVDVFAHFSPIPMYWVDAVLAIMLFVVVAVVPLGVAAYFLVTAVPRLFSHAGWDVQPLEAVGEPEMYTVRYRYVKRHRAPNSWQQTWLRAAQGWVYIEIAAILLGGVAMVPIFISATEFGFGQP